MGDEVEEGDAVLVQRQDVLRALLGLGLPPHREEARAEERPRGQDLQHLRQNVTLSSFIWKSLLLALLPEPWLGSA